MALRQAHAPPPQAVDLGVDSTSRDYSGNVEGGANSDFANVDVNEADMPLDYNVMDMGLTKLQYAWCRDDVAVPSAMIDVDDFGLGCVSAPNVGDVLFKNAPQYRHGVRVSDKARLPESAVEQRHFIRRYLEFADLRECWYVVRFIWRNRRLKVDCCRSTQMYRQYQTEWAQSRKSSILAFRRVGHLLDVYIRALLVLGHVMS